MYILKHITPSRLTPKKCSGEGERHRATACGDQLVEPERWERDWVISLHLISYLNHLIL